MRTIILSLLLLTACSLPRAQIRKTEAVPQKPSQLQPNVHKARWEPIFFRSIDERAKIANLPTLRSDSLPKDDLEVRVWHGFGLTALEGFILSRTSGKWSAMHLEGIHPRLPQSEHQKNLQAPKSGWEECWRKLVDGRILILPDAAEIDCSAQMFDGMSYVVEIKNEATYRTYLYDNPRFAKCAEAGEMIQIGNIIADEFDVPEMSTKE